MSGLIELRENSGPRVLVALRGFGMLFLALCELLIVSIRFDSGVLVEGHGIFRFFADHLPLVPQFAAVAFAATLVFGSKELADCLTKAGSCGRLSYSVPLLFTIHLAIFASFLLTCSYYFEVNHGASGVADGAAKGAA